jgi:MOSC domain-containing protein YiiM
MPQLVAVNVVHALIPGPKDTGLTAIDKRPRTGRVPVGELGLAGDTQCDTKHHGGPDQALYLYAREDADWWAAELGRKIPDGLFGRTWTPSAWTSATR